MSPDALSRAIRAAAVGALVDVRSRAAFLRRHVAGSASIPAAGLLRSLYLLPPRDRPLVVIARDGECAAHAARALSERGWTNAAWLDGAPQELLRVRRLAGSREPRLWEPASLLREFADRLPRSGRALDLACGSGRDATFLALRGLAVLGVDLLPDALRQARALSRRALSRRALARRALAPGAHRPAATGRARFRQTDLTDPGTVARLLPPRQFAVITCFRYLDRALLPRLAGALAPGGILVYQTFLEAQARAGRKPRRAAFLLKPGELRRAFAGLQIVHYHEGEDARGDHLASLVARAPRV